MEWHQALLPPPEIVDGQWSEWSKDLKSGFLNIMLNIFILVQINVQLYLVKLLEVLYCIVN